MIEKYIYKLHCTINLLCSYKHMPSRSSKECKESSLKSVEILKRKALLDVYLKQVQVHCLHNCNTTIGRIHVLCNDLVLLN